MIKNNDYCFFFFEDYFSQLQTKIPQEHAKAQLALRAGKKSEAQLCLTKRKLMENEVRLVTKTRSILPSAKCVKVRRVKCVARKRQL